MIDRDLLCRRLVSTVRRSVRVVLYGFAVLLVSGPLSAQELRVSLTDSDGNPLSEAVIELLIPESQQEQYRDTEEASVDQVNKEFIPRVTTVVAGSEVRFPNSDDILHHVYSFSPARTFNIPLYGRGENINYFEPFPRAGVVEIGCNIHDWMLAYIYVGATSLMAMTNAAGSAVLTDLPTGEYQLKIWHSQLDAEQNMRTETVQLSAGEVSEISLQVELQRDRRLRRAPSASRSRYR